jgi:AcrR family transcriptional regulator
MSMKTSDPNSKDTKGLRTKENILRAARKIFSQHPYHTASMRMIGKEAGIEHPLINYYFPSKAELFEEIIVRITGEFIRSMSEWLDEIKTLRISDGFMKFIDLLMNYNQQKPEALRILALNITQSDNIALIPGYRHFLELMEQILHLFEKKLSPRGSVNEIRMFIHSFNFLIITFLGSSTCVAQVQDMDPAGDLYRVWVKDTLGFLFLPRLREIINPSDAGTRVKKKNSV